MSEHRLVLIGDLVSSRSAPDRASLQRTLSETLDRLNNGSREILSPYTITLGDEFQAVFSSSKGVLADAVRVLDALAPQRARFALGLGAITTELNRERAIGMDGPAFYLAREAISALKETDALFAIAAPHESHALRLGNAALNVLGHAIESWRPNRLHVMNMLIAKRDVSHMASALSISPQAVYKNISDGDLSLWLDILWAIEGLLDGELRA